MAASINVNDYWVNQNQIPTLADVEDGIEQCTISDIDATNMATGASVITIASSAPSTGTGKAWVDTSTQAGSPEVRPRIFNTVSSEWLGWNILYSPTMPATTTTGWLWYDMTAKLLRVYREAAYDPQGIAGWHPVSEQYQLMCNKSGGIIAPNCPVVMSTSALRAFTTTTSGKNATVVGVTLATIASDAYGLVATVAGGASVGIMCNVTNGNIAAGDGIATSTVAKEARTVGALPTNSTAAAAVMHTGFPLGCFAVALEAQTAATVTACRLLGQVGTGSVYRKASTVIAAIGTGLADTNWDAGWDPVDVANYPPSGGGSDFIADAKHKPIAGVILCADVQAEIAGSTGTLAAQLAFGKDASTAFQVLRMDVEEVVVSGSQAMNTSDMLVPTAASGAPTTMGNVFYWQGTRTASAGTPVILSANFRAVGYVYSFLLAALTLWTF